MEPSPPRPVARAPGARALHSAAALLLCSHLGACRLLDDRAAAVEVRPVPAAPTPERVELTREGIENAGVRVETLRPERFGPALTVPARVDADPSLLANVGARAAGRVVALRVRAGDAVAAGDPLVEIDTTELHQVTQEYLTASARVRLAEDALERQRTLQTERIGATQELRRAEADVAAARATFLESEEHLHFLGLREGEIARLRSATSHGEARSIVRSPVAGRVSRVDVSVGQVVAGEARVAVVGSVARVWAVLQVYERDLGRVRVGAPVTLLAPDGAEREAAVAAVADVVDPASRTAEARCALDNADGALRPGMSLVARVQLPSPDAALWLPREAVQPHEGRDVVFVRTAERAFEARPVRVGDERGGRVQVLGGLAAGAQVVVAGAFALRGELEREDLESD